MTATEFKYYVLPGRLFQPLNPRDHTHLLHFADIQYLSYHIAAVLPVFSVGFNPA